MSKSRCGRSREQERRETLAALQHAAGFFRHELRERLRLKRTPELDLRLDTSIERGDRIMRLLRQVQAPAEPAKPEGGIPPLASGGSPLPEQREDTE